jgi:hypothetical protein
LRLTISVPSASSGVFPAILHLLSSILNFAGHLQLLGSVALTLAASRHIPTLALRNRHEAGNLKE